MMPIASKITKVFDSWSVVVILINSLLLNVYLGGQLRKARVIPRAYVKVGHDLSELRAEDKLGRAVTLKSGTDNRPLLLYVFSPTCIWCARNLTNIQLVATIKKNAYRFIGVSLSKTGLEGYLADNKLPFATYTNLRFRNGTPVVFTGTPETILLSIRGDVERVWSGAYSGHVQKEIESVMNLHLPGLTSLKASSGTNP